MKQKALAREVVAVWWVDAAGFSDPMNLEDAKKEGSLPMLSVGLLVSDEGSVVRFAQDYYRLGNGQERVRDIEIIPKAYITKMRKWKV